MSTTTNLFNLVEEIRIIADELEANIESAASSDHLPKGTIVKAKEVQNRFKAKSMWVSLGDGTYKHLTGKKGLTATDMRLNGYVDVIFQP
jgi:hypothetical protein